MDFTGLAVSRKKESHTPVYGGTLLGGSSRMGGQQDGGAAGRKQEQRRMERLERRYL